MISIMSKIVIMSSTMMKATIMNISMVVIRVGIAFTARSSLVP